MLDDNLGFFQFEPLSLLVTHFHGMRDYIRFVVEVWLFLLLVANVSELRDCIRDFFVAFVLFSLGTRVLLLLV